MKHYLHNVEVAIEHESKFLVIKRPEGKHAGGLLAFPGGKVEETDEKDERDILRAAAKREVNEEVGLELKDRLEYISSYYFVIRDGIHLLNTLFHFKADKTFLNVVPSKREVDEYYWMSPEDINAASNSPEWFKNYVRDIIDLRPGSW